MRKATSPNRPSIGQHPEPRLQGREAEDLLHELRPVEDDREEDGREHQHRQAGGAEALVRDHVRRDQRRLAGAALDLEEGDEQDDAEHEQAQDADVGPAPVDRLVEAEQQGDQAAGDGGDPQVVDLPLAGLDRGLVDELRGGERREGGDRQVEVEDGPPAELVGEDAADQRTEGVAEPGDPENQPARKRRALGGQGGERHAEDRRPHQGPADAHPDPGADQEGGVRSDRPQQREAGEDRRADEEDLAPAEHVGQPPAGDQAHPEDERVGVDRPLDRADVDVEVLLHRRQGDVERREVVGDHEHAEPHREQRKERPARESARSRHRA